MCDSSWRHFCPHTLQPVITSCLMKTTGAPFSLLFYLVARCFEPSEDEGCDCRWWWWKPQRAGPRIPNHNKQRSVVSPQWEGDPITGLCNWSEPLSALCNSIRSACCSQLGRGLPLSLSPRTMWVTSQLQARGYCLDTVWVWEERAKV